MAAMSNCMKANKEIETAAGCQIYYTLEYYNYMSLKSILHMSL